MSAPKDSPLASLGQLELVVHNSPDFIGVADLSGTPVFVNQAALKLVGLTWEEMLRTPVVDFFVPEERAMVREVVLPAVLNEGRWVGEMTFNHFQTGARIPVLYNAFRMDDPVTGQPVSLATITRALSGEKARETELRDAQQHIASVLAATEVGTWTYEIAPNRVVADANLSRMFGVSAEEAAGGVLEAYLRAIHPEDRPQVEAKIGEALAHGEKFTAEYRLVQKDGSMRWVLARGSIERDAAGNALRMPGVVLDITERVQAETERGQLSKTLEQERRTIDTLLSAMVDFAYIFDLDGRFVYINPPLLKLWGLNLKEAVGKNFFDLQYPDELAARLQQQIQQVINTKQLLSDKTPYTGPSGQGGFYEYIFSPVLSAEGAVEFVAGTTRDISTSQHALEALQRSEEDFRTLADTLPDTVWTADPQGRILWTNSVLPRITGLSFEDIQRAGHQALVHPEDQHIGPAAGQAAQPPGSAFEFHHRVRMADGSWRWHQVRANPARDAQGTTYRWIGTSTDVHEQRELNARLERSEAEFRQLANTMPQIVWAAQPDGVLDYYNLRWFEYINLDPAVGDEASWDRYIFAEDLPRAYQSWMNALQSGEPYTIEFRVRRGDGEYRWFLVRALPMRDATGTITRWFGTCTDIHHQRELQTRLERSEAHFRQLADSIPQLAWMARPDGWIFWYNNRWHDYTGTTPEQMEGWGWQTVHDPAVLPQVVANWETSIQSGDPFDMTFPLKGADGVFRPFLTRTMPFRDDSGEIVLWFGTNTDVSEQRRMVQERDELLASERAARSAAERASRMKDEFLATLSHELRSPLNAIFGWTQILRESDNDRATLEEGIEVIDRNVRIQTQLIEDLLDMSRIISGKLRMDVQPVNPAECIRAAIETVMPAADAKGIRVEKILDSEAGPVSGDPGRIQQIIWNLLSNAIKFTPRGGKVQVLLERVNSHLEISVSDTGQGISAEFLPHVFDRFRQEDAATNRHHGGLGLGLAIVKQLVELHGGSIRAKSAGERQGSTFIVHLPLKAVHIASTPEERHHPRTAISSPAFQKNGSLADLRVLIVDDEKDARELLKRVLHDCGAKVTTASSAIEALALIQSQPLDVLVSDIGMPEVDGYEFLRRVRSLPSGLGGRIPAVALTAFARSEDRTKALLAGFLAHVSKPVEPAELVATITAVSGRTVIP